MIFLFSCNDKTVNDLQLPKKEHTEKIEVKHNEEIYFITNKEDISNLIDAFKLAKLTKQKSAQDFPTTSDDYYLLCFKDKNNEEIYMIADEEFNLLTKK